MEYLNVETTHSEAGLMQVQLTVEGERGGLAVRTTALKKRLSVNWKHSTNASSLRRVIGKEISTGIKIYKDTHKDEGTQLSMIESGR